MINKMTRISSWLGLLFMISTVASLSLNNASLYDSHKQSCDQVRVKQAPLGDWDDIEYDDEDSCSWRIESTTGVVLYIDNVHLHSSDQLTIYDGDDDTVASEELSSENEGAYYYSSGTTMFIKFASSSDDNDEPSALSKKKNEFEIEFKDASTVTSKDNHDQYLFTSTEWRSLSSPNYIYLDAFGHGHDKDKKMSYSWILRSSSLQHHVFLQLNHSRLGAGDSLMLYDGQLADPAKIITSDFQESETYQSTREYILVKYQSSGGSDSNGFIMQYRSEQNGDSNETTPGDSQGATTNPTFPWDPTKSNSTINPGVMTVLWILLFFSIILICPLMYKLVTRCCGKPEPRRNRGDDGTRWVVTSDLAHDNVGFHKQPGDDLPPAYDTLSIKSTDKQQYDDGNQDGNGEDSSSSSSSSSTLPPPSYAVDLKQDSNV